MCSASAASQAETRLYFDLIRSGGENNFLHFMPPGVRTAMRDSWYQGERGGTEDRRRLRQLSTKICRCRLHYRGEDPKAEFVALVSARLKSLAGPPDCAQPLCATALLPHRRKCRGAAGGGEPADIDLAAGLNDGMQFVDFMPDVSFVRVSTGDPEADLAYTLIRNKAHTNVAFMLGEEKRREPGKDTLTAYPRTAGQLPQFHVQRPAG